jgi:hypothetical protein
MSETGEPRAKLSAFVIAYNREEIIGTCLRALRFADEIIVVDKSSTDATPAIAAGLADRVIRVPWTPIGEETRAFALSQCTHDWVLFLDDDECLDAAAVRFIDAELRAPRADIYRLPLRHYILGRHDERAYYWPEHHVRWFRRGTVSFAGTVHGGLRLESDNIHTEPADSAACIHHLSHRDVAQWIEKSNRYTSQPDRVRTPHAGASIARFAHARIDHWLERTKPCEPGAYPEAVAVLRSVYDLIDRLKTWEEEAGSDGGGLFRAACARLDAAYAAELADLARPHGAGGTAAITEAGDPSPAAAPGAAAAQTDSAALERAVLVLRDSVQAQREAMDAAHAALEAARLRETEQRERAAEMQRWAESASREARDFETTLATFRDRHEAMVAQYDATIAGLAADRTRFEADRETERTHLETALHAASARADAAEHHARALEASLSWRITAPLRAAVTRLRR